MPVPVQFVHSPTPSIAVRVGVGMVRSAAYLRDRVRTAYFVVASAVGFWRVRIACLGEEGVSVVGVWAYRKVKEGYARMKGKGEGKGEKYGYRE